MVSNIKSIMLPVNHHPGSMSIGFCYWQSSGGIWLNNHSRSIDAIANWASRRSLWWKRASLSGICRTQLNRWNRDQPIGMTGFEPAAPSSRTKCATKLRHIPIEVTVEDDLRFSSDENHDAPVGS